MSQKGILLTMDRRMILVALVVSGVALAGMDVSAEALVVFEDGAYKADIVVPEKMGDVEKLAAEELAYHFKKAFG